MASLRMAVMQKKQQPQNREQTSMVLTERIKTLSFSLGEIAIAACKMQEQNLVTTVVSFLYFWMLWLGLGEHDDCSPHNNRKS